MKRLLTGLALALAAASLTAPARAMEINYSVSCLGEDELRSYLGRAFSEGRVAEGTFENGNRMELFAARDGSWTLIELPGDGYGCVHSSGHGLKVERFNQPKRPAS